MVFMAVTLAYPVFAASFLLTKEIDNAQFNLTENVTYWYDINVTTNESYVQYSDNSNTIVPPYNIFNLSADTGVIQFVPNNTDVGVSQWITIIVENRSQETDDITFKIRYNVSNTNNRPFIYNGSPGNVSMYENTTLNLSVSVYDPDSIHGDYILYNWTVDGNLSSKLNFTNSSAWYDVPYNNGDLGSHIITCIAMDTGGKTSVHSWNITVINSNQVPFFNKSIKNITIQEDENITNNISLRLHFFDFDVNASNHDTDTGIQLVYNVSCANTNDSIEINISIDQDSGNVSFFPPDDWTGNKTFFFTVFDGIATAFSNNFTFSTSGINDPPVIHALINQTIYANNNFNYQVNASDVDFDSLNYYSNSTVFMINRSTGLISVYVESWNAGLHVINISVDDGTVNVSKLLNVTVLPNVIPHLDPIADQSVQQDGTIYFNVTGRDDFGDNLTFIANFSDLGTGDRINGTMTTFNISPTAQSLVGNHTVNITVFDGKGVSNSTVFVLEIRDFPKAPVLANVQDFTVRANKTFTYNLSAFDEDGNIHLFSANTTVLTIVTTSPGSTTANATGYMTFTPNATTFFAVNITVNDTSYFSDSIIITINVTKNSAPYFTFIDNITCGENTNCPQGFSQFTAVDPDWQDTATFSDNTSLFNISSDGHLSFTAGTARYDAVEINITDGEITVSYIIMVNITELDDPPFFDPPVHTLPAWSSIVENGTSAFNVTAFDEENASLNFSVYFINFTMLNGSTYYSGIDLFTIQNLGNFTYNMTVGFINFTPNSSQVGTYWVNISVADGYNTNSTIFSFQVNNVNNPPTATWNLTYGNYSTTTQTAINVTENTSLTIQVQASDPDFNNLTYAWYRDKKGTVSLIGTHDSIIYNISLLDAPFTNLTLRISDVYNASYNITWFLNVTDVNRMHTFGVKRYTSFPGRTFSNVTNTSSVALIYSGTYPAQGIFESNFIDFGMTNTDRARFVLDRIEYSGTVPASTSVTVLTRTRTTPTSNFSNWTQVGVNGSIQSPDRRYLQYRLLLETSVNSTPVIEELNIYYGIANITAEENTLVEGWINLENFFSDPDSDEIFTYQAFTQSLAFYANVTVTADNFVRIDFIQQGTEYLNISATDSDNHTIYSNLITINVEEQTDQQVQTQIVTTTTSSGGGGTITKYKTRIRTVTDPVNLDIIHPMNVTIFENGVMKIPILLRNRGNNTLTGINISAFSENDFELDISETTFDVLDMDEEEIITITANLTEIYDSFQILVRVDVEDPVYTDTAKITVNTLKKGKADKDLFDIKYAFAEDLLAQNSRCLELQEFLNRARQNFNIEEMETGLLLLDDFIDGCRYLISSEAEVSTPTQISSAAFVVDKIKTDRNIRNLVYLISAVLVFFFGFIAYVKYKRV